MTALLFGTGSRFLLGTGSALLLSPPPVFDAAFFNSSVYRTGTATGVLSMAFEFFRRRRR